jgi:hypothetical protein
MASARDVGSVWLTNRNSTSASSPPIVAGRPWCFALFPPAGSVQISSRCDVRSPHRGRATHVGSLGFAGCQCHNRCWRFAAR